jgi:hypothetical protein
MRFCTLQKEEFPDFTRHGFASKQMNDSERKGKQTLEGVIYPVDIS